MTDPQQSARELADWTGQDYVDVDVGAALVEFRRRVAILPPPVTSDCTLADVEAFLDRARGGDPMPSGPAGDDDWLSHDDPPKPPPKPPKT